MKRTLVKGLVVAAAAVTLPLVATAAATAATLEPAPHSADTQLKIAPRSGDRLATGETLRAGQLRTSQNKRYFMVMQHDGNFVLYKKLRKNKNQALWSTRTTGTGADRIVMQLDGNLVVYRGQQPVWWTGTNPQTNGIPAAGAWLAVQNDSNVVIYSAAANGNKPLWSRHMFIGVLPAGQAIQRGEVVQSRSGRFKFVMQNDSNLVLYDTKAGNRPLWSSNTHGRGGTRVEMQKDGNLVMYRGRTPLWASNTSSPGAKLAVQDDGNAVVYSTPGKALWHTGTGGR